MVMALGGSTNAVLHLIAMARSVGVPLTIDDFQKVSDRVPFLADLKPSGKYVQEDLHHVGGTPAVMKYLLGEGLLDGDCLTVTGKTLAENLADLPGLGRARRSSTRSRIRSSRPATFRFCAATWRPTGAVAKITGKEGLRFSGPAKVYDCEEDMLRGPGAEEDRQGGRGDHSLRRPQGGARHARDAHAHLAPSWAPAWGPTWRCSPTAASPAARTGSSSATSRPRPRRGARWRWSETATGSRSTPRARARRRPRRRRNWPPGARWKAPPYKATRGTLYKYIKNVKSASEGCVTDE